MSKVIINIVYSPQKNPPHKIFENEKGEVWNSPTKDANKINIGMGWYSIRDPKPQDNLLVVEPYCVLDRDYDPNFAGKFNKIFTWTPKAFKNSLQSKIVKINHPSFHSFPTGDQAAQSWKKWDERENRIIFIANNKTSKHHSELYSLRIQLADMLHNKSDLKVSWYGQIPLKRPYYEGKIEDKQEVLSKTKFSVCTENSYDSILSYGYFSEKMPDVWRGGAIPLYMGCYNIDDFAFPSNSYIDLRKHVQKHGKQFKINEKALLEEMHNINHEFYSNWQSDIKKLIDTESFRKQILFSQAYKKIIDTFTEDSE